MTKKERQHDERIYQQLIEYSHDVLFLISPDWQTIYYVSPSYEDIWGKTCQSLLENPFSWTESLHPDDRNSVFQYIEEKSQGKLDDINFPDYRVIRPDGSIKWLKARGLPIRNEKDEIYRIAGIAVDITEQKQKEETLLLNQERLKMVLEGSAQGFWDWNIETGEVKRNDRWAQMLGYSTIEEFEENTDTWTNSIHPADRDAAWQSINDHIEGRSASHSMVYRMFTKDGGYKWIFDNAKIVQRDANGIPLRMCGTHTDITDRKIIEEERDKLIESLQKALSEVNLLKGIIPICSYCHKIRDEKGAWDQLESYISKHSEAEFSHGICPKCLIKAQSEAGFDEK